MVLNASHKLADYHSPSDNFAINEHAIGRLVQQEDATGVQVFGYGRMGEVTKNLRSVAVAGYQSYWFYTGWKYDSWNRIQEITYPDLEKVKYKYNSAGALKSISSTMNGISDLQSVIKNIVYDDYGDRSTIEYGNGTVTNYSYDVRRRMNSLKNNFTNFEIKKNYTFDALSNITDIITAQPQNSLPQPGQIGGTINQAYKYDNYNRLTAAGGQYTGANDAGPPDFNQHYETIIDYNPDHTIKKKSQTHAQISPGSFRRVEKNNYVLDYSDYGTGAFTAGTGYAYTQPHAVRTIIESPDADYIPNNPPDAPLIKRKTISYDANGNQTEIKEKLGTLTTSLRKNLWDEENRLTAVDLKPDDKTGHPISIYTYDSSGERIVRYNSDRMDVSSNAGEIGQNAKDNIMIYPSGLIMGKVYHGMEKTDRVDMVSYTKHYYAGSERVSAKTGTLRVIGSFPQVLLASEMPNLNITAVRAASTASVTDAGAIVTGAYNKFGMTPPPLAPTVENNRTESFHDPARLTISYFHPDHLGSSSYITNAAGIVTQHLEYMAFGEVFVEEHSNSLNSPFKFNGKELDGETGNYYYGARYYDPKLSTFISVDPLAEQTMSAYGYCYNNPVNLIDPSGMKGEEWFKNNLTGEATYISGATQSSNVVGYTYMCAECEKNAMSVLDAPSSLPSEGNVLYEANGNKLPLMEGVSIGDPLQSGNENGNGGFSFGLSIGGAVGGGIGAEVGLVKDFATDNWGAYFSFKGHAGLGGAMGVNATSITPTTKDDFLISDFGGTSMEFSASVNSPLGGGGYNYGGTSPDAANGILDRASKVGQGPRGYTTGSLSPELSGPSAKVSAGALITKSKTWVWDF